MTIDEAAEFLNVSEPFVLKLIAAGELPVWPDGDIDGGGVNAWKRENDRRRDDALDELVRLAQEMGEYD